ncbi:unnamed protein product [Schistosoma curassoni]|uniref:DUF4334 domain-containing protein n=1 Tax=Schistosoma curassoni TaxID=6186 RepID=A0A183K3J7_9TREM|nr:unnamed protein product [Schistosoma curassoni]
MNTTTKERVPGYPLNPPEAKYQEAVNGPSRDIFAGDLVVSKGYRDRARIQAWLPSVIGFVRGPNRSVRIKMEAQYSCH